MIRPALFTIALLLTASSAAATPPKAEAKVTKDGLASLDVQKSDTLLNDVAGKSLLYTTYFYTAGEAIVHGYEAKTDVRIVSLKENRTVWRGVVGQGETKNIPTGQGVFAFLADKKASILVGTPTSCTAVGYYVRDQDGSLVSKRFLTQLPSSASGADNKVIIWAWKDTKVKITNITADKTTLSDLTLKAGKHYTLDATALASLNNNVLDITASGPDISVQIYYDQGFHVPAADGRLAGKMFRTYVGKTTEGHNDLNLINYGRATKATVRDLDSKEILWQGSIDAKSLHSLRLSGKYVQIESDDEISALVAPYNFQGYAEHHFAGGQEGMGIETSFITTTSEQLWIFSYFDNNAVKVTGMDNKTLWEGNLSAGHAQGYFPGAGTYRVKSNAGISVMGGSASCGAEYSPAGGLFRIDEELLKVATMIVEARKDVAAKQGKVLTADELNAPLSSAELDQASDYVKENTGSTLAPAEVQSRMKSMKVH